MVYLSAHNLEYTRALVRPGRFDRIVGMCYSGDTRLLTNRNFIAVPLPDVRGKISCHDFILYANLCYRSCSDLESLHEGRGLR